MARYTVRPAQLGEYELRQEKRGKGGEGHLRQWSCDFKRHPVGEEDCFVGIDLHPPITSAIFTRSSPTTSRSGGMLTSMYSPKAPSFVKPLWSSLGQ